MLGAVMFGHRHFQPVIEAIIRLAEKAAKEPRELVVPDNAALEKQMLGLVEKDLRAAYAIPDKMERHNAVEAAKAKVMAALVPAEERNRPTTRSDVAAVFKELEAKIVRWNILDTGRRIDGRDVKTVRPIAVRGRRAAPRPRLGAVHPRRDPGVRGGDARHRRGRAVHRRAGRHLQGELPAALQFPALLGRRDRPDRVARAARDRPRQARLARHPSDAAAAPRIPLHHPRGVGDHRIERLVVDGDRVRRLARVDGRRACRCGRRPPASPWASSSRTSASRCSPTFSATRTISATWTSRWPAPRRASPRCRWTSRSPASPRRSCGSR